ARIVRGKLHPARTVLRVALQDAPGEIILFASPFGIPGLVAGEMSGNSEHEQVRIRLTEIRTLDHRQHDAVGRVQAVTVAPVSELPVMRLQLGMLENGKVV